jgi:hypothetical protein
MDEAFPAGHDCLTLAADPGDANPHQVAAIDSQGAMSTRNPAQFLAMLRQKQSEPESSP